MPVGVARDIVMAGLGWAGLGFAKTSAGEKEGRRKTLTSEKVTI